MNKYSNKEANNRWWTSVLYILYGDIPLKIKTVPHKTETVRHKAETPTHKAETGSHNAETVPYKAETGPKKLKLCTQTEGGNQRLVNFCGEASLD